MKISTSQLKQMIKEQIEKMALLEAPIDNDPVERIRALVGKMQQLLDAGEIHKLSEDDLDAAKSALRSARARMVVGKRSPEERSASAKKAGATRVKNRKESERIAAKWRAEVDRRAALAKARAEAELLPLEVDGWAGAPNPDYYDEVAPILTGPGGDTVPKYRLKPRWENQKFSPAKRDHALRKARPLDY